MLGFLFELFVHKLIYSNVAVAVVVAAAVFSLYSSYFVS